MTNLKERIARAIIGTSGVVVDASIEDVMPTVQAALEAMISPTVGMISAVTDKWEINQHVFEAVYNEAIKAAIAER